MAKRKPATPKLLLAMTSAILTAITLVYGTTLGWLSIHMMFLYAFFIAYYYSICKGDMVASCYTVAGSLTAAISLLAVKFLDAILGSAISLVTAYFVAFMTDIIVKSDWRYFNAVDFNFPSFPLERNLQLMFDQHVIVSDAPPASEPLAEDEETEEKETKPKKKTTEKSPPSRKEKKLEAKKQKRGRTIKF